MAGENEISELLQSLEYQISNISLIQQKEQTFAIESKQRFHQNLKSFETYQPAVAAAIKEFQPPTDFRLYVTRSGHGNFVPKDCSIPLYNDTPMEQAAAQVDKYCQHATFGRMALYQQGDKLATAEQRIHIRYMIDMVNLIADHEQNATGKKITSLPSEYPSCLMFGIGLGYHLPLLLNKCRFDYIYVCEPEFELFYASLFCIDWAQLLEKIDEQNSSLILHIGVPYHRFFREIQASASRIGAFSIINSFCFQHYPSDLINQQIQEFFKEFYRLQLGFGFFDDALNGFAHMALNLQSKKAHFMLQKPLSLIKSLPVFIVGNGPSLDASLEFIKENQHKAVIMAAGTGLQTLLKFGIVPDFHVLVERTKSVYEILRDTTTPEQLSKLNLLSVELVYPDTIDNYQWVGLGLKGPEASTCFLKIQGFRHGVHLHEMVNAGPLVSNTALSFAAKFGFQEIYLFGVDNGTPESLASTHSKHSIYNDSRFGGKYKPNPEADVVLPGNLGGIVRSSSLLAISKVEADDLLSGLNKNITVYNVGHGAKIEKAIPVEEDDLFIVTAPNVDKQKVVEEIKANHFTPLDFTINEDVIGCEEFENLIDYLVEIHSRPMLTRHDASEMLKSQARVVYAYKDSSNIHLYHMLSGSLLYFHCPMITLLYTYEDEVQTMTLFKQVVEVWEKYLLNMKSMYRSNWLTKCSVSL